MRNQLLTVLAAASIASVALAENSLIDNWCASAISPDGTYVCSGIEGGTWIKNLVTGEEWEFFDSETDASYGFGLGNCISKTGLITGSSYDKAYTWNEKDGWVQFKPTENIERVCLNGITPDAKRIVGYVSSADFGNYGETMILPAYWDLQDDGSWSQTKLLPFPAKDYTDRDPQYVTAIFVSDDGKTIGGMYLDYQGVIGSPIVYRENEDGSWEYDLIGSGYVNPEGLKLPEYPVAPEPVEATDYMTEEERAEYEKALKEWAASGYQDPYPEAEDYMSDENKLAYLLACDKYTEEAQKFNNDLENYYIILNKIQSESMLFIYNGITMSPDGTKLAVAAYDGQDFDFMSSSKSLIVNFDLKTGKSDIYEYEESLSPTVSLDNGCILATNPAEEMGCQQAFIKTADKDSFITLVDYFKEESPAAAEWMIDNLTHEYDTLEGFDEEGFPIFGTATGIFSGVPYFDNDMKTFFGGTISNWSETLLYQSYVLTGLTVSVDAVETSGFDVKCLTDGRVMISGKADNLEIYSVNGAKVFASEVNSNEIQVNIPKGIYIVKVLSGNDRKVVKAFF